jgi:MFS family permease
LTAPNLKQGEPLGYLALVRSNRDFRFLWFGQIVSLLGDWFNLIASASLIGYLTQSGIAVGGLFVVRMLAPFLVSPFAGVAADRYNRKHLLILADIGRAITVLGFLLVREPDQVWLLYVLTAIQLAMSGFFFPARNAILPDLVERRELGTANALSAATWSVMLAFGAALGGIVAGQFGVYPAFVIDGFSFLLSAVLIARIVYHHEPALASADKSVAAAIRQYVDGLRYLWRHKDNLAIALHKGAFALAVSGADSVVQVAIARRVFVIGEGGGTGLGILYATLGVGTGIGPILARHFTGDKERSLRIAIAVSYGLASLGLLIMSSLSNFGVLLVGTTIRGIGGGVVWVFATQLILQRTPDRVRGRVFSTEFAIFTLMSATGSAGGGWLIDNSALGISGMLRLMASLVLIPGVLWVLWNLVWRKKEPPLDISLLDADAL